MCGCMPLSLLFLVSFNSPFRSSSSFLSSSFSFLHSFCYRFTSLSCSGRGKKTRCHSSLHPSLLFHSSRQNSLQTVITMRTRRFFFFFSSSSSSLSPSSPSSCFHLKDLDLSSSSSRESLSSASPSSSYTSCCSLFFPSKIPLSPPIPHCHSRTSSSSLFPLLLHASSPPLPSPLSSSSCLSCPFFSSLHSLPSLRRAPLSLISPACLSPTCFSFSSSSPPDRKKNRESSSSFSSSSSSSSPTPSLASPSLSILTHEEHLSLDAILNLVNSLLKDKHFVSFAHVHTPQHPASSAGLTPGEFIVCLHRIAEAYKRTNDKDLLLSSASSFEKTEDEEDSAERKRKRTLSRDFRFRLLLRKVQNRLLSFTAVELYRLLVALSRLGYCPRELLSSILRLLAPEPPLPSSLQASSLSSSSNISFSSPPPESLRNLSSLQLSHLPILLSSLVSRANSEENENLRTFLIAYTSYVSSTLLSQVSPSSPSSSLSQEERKEEEEQNVDIEEGQQQEKEERRSSSSSLRDPSSTSSLHLSQKDQRETPSSSSCSPLHPHHFSSASSPSLESPPKSFSLNDLSFIAIGMSTLGYRDLSFLSLLAEAVTCELEKRQEREGEEESLESRGKNLAGGDRRRRAGERGQEGEEEEDFLLIRKSRECLPLVNCLFSFATLGILHPRLYHCLFSSLRQNLKFLTSSQLANTTLAVASLTALGEASSFFPFAFLSSLETALEERCSAGGRKKEGERKGRSSSLSLFYLEREEAATLAWALCSLRLYEGNPGLFTKLLFHASPYIPNAAAFTPAAAIDRREDERSLVDEEEEEVQKEDQEEEEEEIIQHLQQIRIDLRLSSSPSIKRFYQDDRRTPEEKRLWNWLVGTDANVDAVDVDACGDARSSLETEERKRRSIDDADKHDNDHDEDEQKEEEEKKKNRRRIEGRREREDSSQIPSDVLQAEAQIYDLLENDQNLLLRLLHQSSEEKTAKDTKCIFMTAVSSELSSHSISPSSFTLSPDASSSSSSVSSSPHLADDQEDLGLYSSHDRDRSGTLVDRSRLCLEKGGIACGFYRCSLIAHYKNEPRIEKEAEIRSFEKEKGPERDIEERDASCIRKLAVIVDFTTFADLSGPTDIFLAMKYRHILLSNYSLIIVRFAEWKELSSDEERKAYLFANVVNQRRRDS